MAVQENESVGGFSNPGVTPGGGAALQYQHFTTDTNSGGFLHGGTLGRGNRSVPSSDAFFSPPAPSPTSGRNLSGGQFGSGGAKDTMEEENE